MKPMLSSLAQLQISSAWNSERNSCRIYFWIMYKLTQNWNPQIVNVPHTPVNYRIFKNRTESKINSLRSGIDPSNFPLPDQRLFFVGFPIPRIKSQSHGKSLFSRPSIPAIEPDERRTFRERISRRKLQFRTIFRFNFDSNVLKMTVGRNWIFLKELLYRLIHFLIKPAPFAEPPLAKSSILSINIISIRF